MSGESDHATASSLRPRLSIGVGMTLIAFFALAFAALRSPSALWSGVFVSASTIVLCAALLGVIYRSGRARCFWVGFAIFGWIYWLITFSTGFLVPAQRTLLSTWAWEQLFLWVHPTAPLINRLDTHFLHIGHAITSLLAGLFGGLLAVGFAATREREHQAG